ncbi:hypothetical protein [uncultured Ruegeria sp.]|uniref:phage integrase central domain-containing protein n=1 Tax=uncultured Ruegeria sp. TaxID=259304 RepID=UPI002633846D|nr:hypothetical protein [uncultured Ruegeria sp.]
MARGNNRLSATQVKNAAPGSVIQDGGGLALKKSQSGGRWFYRLQINGKRGMWYSLLKNHVTPKVGKHRISTLHQRDIHDTLKPIWRTKHETADKAMYRTRMVLRQAKLWVTRQSHLSVMRPVVCWDMWSGYKSPCPQPHGKKSPICIRGLTRNTPLNWLCASQS